MDGVHLFLPAPTLCTRLPWQATHASLGPSALAYQNPGLKYAALTPGELRLVQHGVPHAGAAVGMQHASKHEMLLISG